MADQKQQSKSESTSTFDEKKQAITFFKDAPAYNDINMPADPSPETEITDNREIATADAAANIPFSQASTVKREQKPFPPTLLQPTPMAKMMSDINDNIQQLELTDAEQIENTVIRYVKLLDPADKYYIKYQHVYDNGEKYIAYLKGTEHMQYKKERKALESKYSSNKRYTVEVTKKKVIVYKKDSEGNTDKAAKLDELTRPTYINLTEIFDKSHKNITQSRLRLKAQYNQFVTKPYIALAMKNKFIKQRETMINKLNDFYSIQYFYNKVNGIVQTEKLISLPKIYNYYSENKQELVPRLISKNISMPVEDLQLLYANGANKLELYNKIQEMLATESDKKKEITELIKQYINFDEEQQRELLYTIEKKKNHQIINYIVIPTGIEIPVDNSIIRPRDMKPFFAMQKRSSTQ
jgi:hypothetical protein